MKHFVQKIHSYDLKVLLQVQSWRRDFLNTPFKILTFSGTSKVWFACAILLYVLSVFNIRIVEQQVNFLSAMRAALIAWLACKLLKKWIGRERPSLKIEGYRQIHKIPACGSWPSGHTASAIAFFFALLFSHHPLALIVGVWAFLVSFSRMYLGVHFLSDILGGVLVGFLSALIVQISA